MSFWDNIKTKLSMPYQSPGSQFVKPKAMEFKVGEGLKPEQAEIAEEVVRKPDTFTNFWGKISKPEALSFSESLNVFNSAMQLSAAEKQGQSVESKFMPSKEMITEAIDVLSAPVIGSSSGLKKPGLNPGGSKKIPKRFFALTQQKRQL